MARTCCVDECSAKDDIYFRFPNSRMLCKKWMEALELSSRPGHNSVICSAHFKPDDYALVRGKVRLKAKVIPTLHKNERSTINKSLDNSLLSSEKVKNNQLKQEEDRTQENDTKKDVNNKRVDIKSPNNDDNVNNKKSTRNRRNSLMKHKENGKVQKSSRSRGKRKSKTDKEKRLKTKKKKEGSPPESITETIKPSADTAPEKEDIEEFLTYFHIKQNKDVAERQNAELQRERNLNGDEVIDLAQFETEAKPVFIEVSVDRDNPGGRGSGDCMMVMESVQVELDPNDLLLPEMDSQERDEPIVIDDKADEAISLLTSSDEDDVIYQEPHIDTVVVSDEEGSPAVQLLVCPTCGRSTASHAEIRKHRKRHRAEFKRKKRAQFTR